MERYNYTKGYSSGRLGYYPSRYGRSRHSMLRNVLSILVLSSLVFLIAFFYLTDNPISTMDKVLGKVGLSLGNRNKMPEGFLSNDGKDGKYHGAYPNSLLTLFWPYTMLRDVVLDQPVDDSDVPFFWHIHKSEERVVKRALTQCYGMELVELNDLESIQQAKELKLASGIDRNKHVLTSPFIRAVSELFTTDNFGRVFAFFRHPLDYEVDETLPRFPRNDDWLTRYLAHHHDEDITFKELGVAKHVIRQCCVVGTIDTMKESILRIGAYFGWELKDDDEDCIEDILLELNHPQAETWVDHESPEWANLYNQSRYDCELYEIARSTWRAQIQTIIPYNIQLSRNEDEDEEEET
eukprot:CAMPEP_0184861758 /NCGR_PEP_ID=MMETSP0580-20130426/6363_1 /TAXON_ID=1118495 /ORGANISM="Dactyliosolen fragilissimus" /LENGTH=351 /DNA_ID=CAMNT_0027359355 /DNA_START=53 /DNA_END=1108 /DNA_ORIENTATION=-